MFPNCSIAAASELTGGLKQTAHLGVSQPVDIWGKEGGSSQILFPNQFPGASGPGTTLYKHWTKATVDKGD